MTCETLAVGLSVALLSEERRERCGKPSSGAGRIRRHERESLSIDRRDWTRSRAREPAVEFARSQGGLEGRECTSLRWQKSVGNGCSLLREGAVRRLPVILGAAGEVARCDAVTDTREKLTLCERVLHVGMVALRYDADRDQERKELEHV